MTKLDLSPQNTGSENAASQQPIELRLEIERVDLLYRQNIRGIIALLTYASTYLIATWSVHSSLFNWSWGSIVLGSGLLRIVATFRWRKARPHLRSIAETRFWLRLIEGFLFISGMSWAVIAWTMPSLEESTHQILTSAIVVFMSAGGVVSYSASIAAALLVYLPSMGAWTAAMFLSGDQMFQTIGALSSLYILIGYYTGKSLNQYVLRSIRHNIENTMLTADLKHQITIKDQAREELRESQERLALALESSGAVSWNFDPNSQILTFEGNLSSAFAIDSRSFTGTLDEFLRLIHADDRTQIKDAMMYAAQTGSAVDCEYRMNSASGHIKHIVLRGRAHSGASADTRRLTGISYDVTDKKIQETLHRERSESEAANKAKSVFLANASHEIRTPLAAINGFTDMLLQDPAVQGEQRSDLEMISRNGRYLVSLVNDLLDLSKIETGQLYIQKSWISPVQEIHDCVAMIEAQVQSKGVSLTTHFSTPIPQSIESDATRFREILLNLLTNSSKYTQYGSISLDVSFEPLVDAGQSRNEGILKVRVRDTGIGISPSMQARLFQPFVRGENFLVQSIQGSGLGLALSRTLARALGGDLNLVRSEEGRGSEFELRLATGPTANIPLVTVTEPTAPESVEVPRTESRKPLSGRRVLVVDDSVDLQALMRRYLEKQGAQVDTSSDGGQAIDRAFSESYDVILMDIKMPIVDGYTATSSLRSKGYRKPIIALTAHASTADRLLCYQVGFDSYISKPVDFGHLLQSLSYHLPHKAELHPV